MKKTLVFELDAEELAVRLAEASFGVKRPPGKSNKEALATLDAATPVEPMGQAMHRAAVSAILYFTEQASKAGVTGAVH